MSPRRRTAEGAPAGEPEGPNKFELARGVANNVLGADSYNGAQLTSAMGGLIDQVRFGINPGDSAAKLERYSLIGTVLGQAADKAAKNADELTASTFRAHQATFGEMADLLRDPAPARPLPPSSAMKGAKG